MKYSRSEVSVVLDTLLVDDFGAPRPLLQFAAFGFSASPHENIYLSITQCTTQYKRDSPPCILMILRLFGSVSAHF